MVNVESGCDCLQEVLLSEKRGESNEDEDEERAWRAAPEIGVKEICRRTIRSGARLLWRPSLS